MRTAQGVRSLAMGALLFSAGMCSSDRVRYQVATMRASEELPRATVAYTGDGTYVNGEPVRRNGLIGLPRCEVDSMAMDERGRLGVQLLHNQPSILGDYVSQIGQDAWRTFLYQTLKKDFEADSVRNQFPR